MQLNSFEPMVVNMLIEARNIGLHDKSVLVFVSYDQKVWLRDKSVMICCGQIIHHHHEYTYKHAHAYCELLHAFLR